MLTGLQLGLAFSIAMLEVRIEARTPARFARIRMTCYDPVGNANATYVPPEGASFFPPPHAITMNARPFTT